MSMLAEPKRKTKWVINPTKRPLWTTDSNGIKFGKDLMQKMGWSAGKGLGVNEQGIQEPLKVPYKNDTKGMGFKGNDDDWIEQQDEFNKLLNQLRNDNISSIIKTSEEERVTKSLEEKSKQSRARVHYQKFTKGKDLSQYSDNDLACILGTSKTKKEKSKIEDVTLTKSKVVDNCETSFGVTTINGGTIQDYFKKKWIIDKKSNNSSDKSGNAAETSSGNCLKTESCFLKNEHNSMSGSKEKKFKKRKHKSDFENYLNVNESKTYFDLVEVESFENSIKSRKKNQEFQECNLEEVKVKRVKKNYDDNNILAVGNLQKSENHLVDVLNYEESKNLVHATGSYNSVKKRRKEKNQLKLDVTKDEKNYDCIAEKKRKINHENGFIAEVPFQERFDCMTKVKFSLEEEINEKRKEKKSEKEMLKKINELKEENGYISSAALNSQNDIKVIEFCLETDSVKKKKKKEKEEKYLKNKDIESKCHSSNEDEYLYDHSDKNVKWTSKEKINGIIGRDDGLDINDVKKRKKKKYKKEKSEEEESINNHIRPFEKFILEEELREKNINTNEQENVVKGELYKKKKKKKHKKEKKKKEERETENINCCTNHEVEIQVQENTPELELMKKKKKKKEKRKKLDEKEKAEMDVSYDQMGKSVLEEISEKTNINNVNIDSTQTKSIKKEKNEKEKYIKNKEESCKHLPIENKFKEHEHEKIEKPRSKVVDRNINLSNNNKNPMFQSTINDKIEEGSGVHRHKVELLNEKRADKFYPGQYTKDRVLRLISLSDIAGFKGSNLDSVTGYGFLTKYEKNESK